MKKVIYNKETHQFITLDEDDGMDSLKESMASFTLVDKPKIGIWWLDINDLDFFGVFSADEDTYKPDKYNRKVYNKMHYQVWRKEHFRELAKRIPVEDQKFKGDYTKIPRGRVNWESGKFVVYVGSWIANYEDVVTNNIKLYFNLNDEDFEYQVDTHWELGHGWSGDKFV